MIFIALGRLGLYRSSVREQYVPYIKPQAHGNHAGTRWISLRDSLGAGIVCAGPSPMHVTASHFSQQDLYRADHTHELVERDAVYLHLDCAQAGLGNFSCGPETLKQYRVKPGIYRFTYYISVVKPGESDEHAGARLRAIAAR